MQENDHFFYIAYVNDFFLKLFFDISKKSKNATTPKIPAFSLTYIYPKCDFSGLYINIVLLSERQALKKNICSFKRII